MSLHLLPVKTGRESFPVQYRNLLPYSLNWRVGLTCERNRMLYIVMQASRDQYTDLTQQIDDGRLFIYKMNTITNEIYPGKLLSWEDACSTNAYWTCMIANDDFLYVTTSFSTIRVYRANGINFISEYSYDLSNRLQASGKMMWLDKTRIVMCHPSGLLLFDTKSSSYRMIPYPSAFNALDFTVGKKYVAITSSTNNAILLWNYITETFSSFNTDYPASSHVCAANGRLYFGATDVLHVYDEKHDCMESKLVVAWKNLHSLYWTNGTLFAPSNNSRQLFIYGFTFQFELTKSRPENWGNDYRLYYRLDADGDPEPITDSSAPTWVEDTFYKKEYLSNNFKYIYLPWTIVPCDAYYRDFNVATAANGWFYIAKNTFGFMDYSGNVKYNFGDRYDELTLFFNASNRSQFNYDMRFIVFMDTYMTLRDGDLGYVLRTIDAENHIKSASIDKSQYKKFHSLEFIE